MKAMTRIKQASSPGLTRYDRGVSRLRSLVRSSTGIIIGVVLGVCLVFSVLLDNLRTGVVTGLVACGFAVLAFALIDMGRPHDDHHHHVS